MYTYIIVDPRAFTLFKKGPNQSGITASQQGAEQCFKTIANRNAIMILDNDNLIKDDIKKSLVAYSSRLKNVSIFFESILSNKKFVLVQTKEKSLDTDLIVELFRFNERALSDIIVIDKLDKSEFIEEKLFQTDLIYFNTFNSANNLFLDRTDKYRDDGFRINESTIKTKLISTVGRLVQFAKEIKFYDPIICNMHIHKSKEQYYGKKINPWFHGFHFILKTCLDYSYYINDSGELKLPDNEKIKIKIITKKQNGIDQSIHLNRENSIQDIIIKNLKNTPGFDEVFNFELIVKEERNFKNIFRSRYMVTKQSTVNWDKGFGLFEPDGTFKKNYISYMGNSKHIKAEIRDIDCLPDA